MVALLCRMVLYVVASAQVAVRHRGAVGCRTMPCGVVYAGSRTFQQYLYTIY